MSKYLKILQMSLRVKRAYLKEQLFTTIFLVVVLYIFVNLWSVVYGGESAKTIAGFTVADMIWYLVFTESVILSLPNVSYLIEEEVQTGLLALRLNKPYSYLGYHLFNFLGESAFRFFMILTVGSLTAFPLVGLPSSWLSHGGWHLLMIPILYLSTVCLHFLYFMMVGLSAFWLEDVKGLFFIFDRVKWIFGGFFMPLEIFPDALRKVLVYFPFPEMIYRPAKLFIQFNGDELFSLWLKQGLWLMLFFLLVYGMYLRGVKRLELNGG